MTQFFLVRHGPTHLKSMIGWTDAPADLSDVAALSRLSAHLPQDAVVVSSDLIRAVTTADAVQGTRPRLPHDPDLRELNFGRWEQRLYTEAEAEDPALARAFLETPGTIRAPGGESWDDLARRVLPAIDRLTAQHPHRPVVVVAHFVVILIALQRAMGATATDVLAHKIDNLSVTEVSLSKAGWDVRAINRRP